MAKKSIITASITEINANIKKLRKEHEQALEKARECETNIKFLETLITLKKTTKSLPHAISGLDRAEIPSEYDKDMFNHYKVLYALDQLKEATVKDIADYLYNLEKGIDYKLLYNTVLQMVIKLTKELKVIKEGNYKSSYRINYRDE